MEEYTVMALRPCKERQRATSQMGMPNLRRSGMGPGRRADGFGRGGDGASVVNVSRVVLRKWGRVWGSEKGRKDQQLATCLLSAPDAAQKASPVVEQGLPSHHKRLGYGRNDEGAVAEFLMCLATMGRRAAEERFGVKKVRMRAVQAGGNCASPFQGDGGQSKGETETATQTVENEGQRMAREPARGPEEAPTVMKAKRRGRLELGGLESVNPSSLL